MAGGASVNRYAERRVVRFQDVDAAGVVFHARVFDYFHDAYVNFLRATGVPLEEALRDGAWAAPLRHAEADYQRPLRFGQEVTVSLALAAVDETEYVIRYRVEVEDGVACEGRTVHVSVDPENFRRRAVPDVLRRALAQLPDDGSSMVSPPSTTVKRTEEGS